MSSGEEANEVVPATDRPQTGATFALYALYVQTAEKVSDRRGALNSWMLVLMNAVVGLDAGIARAGSGASDKWNGFLVPLVGMITSLVWICLLNSYRDLNAAKFKVIFDLEEKLGFNPFRLERAIYKAAGRAGLTRFERYIPLAFLALFALILGLRLSEHLR